MRNDKNAVTDRVAQSAKVLEHVNRVLETDIRLLQLLNQSAL